MLTGSGETGAYCIQTLYCDDNPNLLGYQPYTQLAGDEAIEGANSLDEMKHTNEDLPSGSILHEDTLSAAQPLGAADTRIDVENARPIEREVMSVPPTGSTDSNRRHSRKR